MRIVLLVDEVDTSVLASISSRTETTDAPSPHAIATTCEIAFLERQDGGVAIRICYAKTSMNGKIVAVIQGKETGIVGITLDILCIGNA